MRTWLTNLLSTSPTLTHRPHLAVEVLEARELPAITIQIDYSRDTSGFFNNNPAAQALLQQAAGTLAGQISASLSAITPGGVNTWAESFYDPSSGQLVSVNNPYVAGNTIVVYAGARVLGGGQASVGGPGGNSVTGTQDWHNLMQARGPGGGGLLWGGVVAFDTTTNWWFGSSAAGIGSAQVDFLTCATHELEHVLGLGTATQWFSQVSNGTFTGPHAQSIYGGPVPVTWGAGGELADVTVGGASPVMDLHLTTGTRSSLTSLDWALLQDIGWSVSGGQPAPPPFTPPPLSGPGVTPVVLTGPTDGSARAFTLGSSGQLVAAGGPVYPFPGFTGVIRSAVADLNGDGVPDYAFATGSGPSATVVVYDGKTGAALVPPTTVLGGFTGGVYLAAGAVDRGGQAVPILAVSADAGGGTRVQVFAVGGGGLTPLADFLAFGDPGFRGGSRVALGDVNRDGSADLIVGAGIGGGPRVAIYSGAALGNGQVARLVPDFFALDRSLRSGVFVTAADFNGDGYADIAYSTGDTGGPRVRVVSGAVLVGNPGANVANLPALADFFALDQNDRSGIRLAARDLTGGGQADLIVASGDAAHATVRVIPLSQMGAPTTPVQDPFSNPATINGVYVG
ncbi:MAG: repeat protein [Gemmataceae bacterium]|nr:repeat protein [Gemmataceae bacterium]